MADVIAERYSQALFDLAEEKNLLKQTEEDVTFVRELMDTHPELYRYLQLPDVETERKQKALEHILKDSVSRPMMGLMQLLIKKARVAYLRPILDGYIELLMAYHHQVKVQITSAAVLNPTELRSIQETLEQSLQKEILMETMIDPALIGGLIVRIGDTVYDNSIRSSLTRLSKHLKDLRIMDEEKVV